MRNRYMCSIIITNWLYKLTFQSESKNEDIIDKLIDSIKNYDLKRNCKYLMATIIDVNVDQLNNRINSNNVDYLCKKLWFDLDILPNLYFNFNIQLVRGYHSNNQLFFIIQWIV